jgi:hypothetical protein
MSGRDALLPLPTDLAAFAGHTVAAHRVDVLSVPANEGAWVGTDAKNHIWVEFIGPGESPFHLVAGQHLTFSGKLLRNPPEYSEAVGLPAGLDASELDRMGLHIEANYNAVHISR